MTNFVSNTLRLTAVASLAAVVTFGVPALARVMTADQEVIAASRGGGSAGGSGSDGGHGGGGRPGA